jgi:hypothetical protein
MTEHIDPALTSEEWGEISAAARDNGLTPQAYLFATDAFPFRALAMANAALPEDDPRKITRETVNALYGVSEAAAEWHKEHLTDPKDQEFAENQRRKMRDLWQTLVALLPPEGT